MLFFSIQLFLSGMRIVVPKTSNSLASPHLVLALHEKIQDILTDLVVVLIEELGDLGY